jgi:hypothetical protein
MIEVVIMGDIAKGGMGYDESGDRGVVQDRYCSSREARVAFNALNRSVKYASPWGSASHKAW